MEPELGRQDDFMPSWNFKNYGVLSISDCGLVFGRESLEMGTNNIVTTTSL